MPIRITSSTNDVTGRKRRWTRMLAGLARKTGFTPEPTTIDDAIAYVERQLPSMFYGCGVTITLQTGEPVHGIVDPDTRRFVVSGGEITP